VRDNTSCRNSSEVSMRLRNSGLLCWVLAGSAAVAAKESQAPVPHVEPQQRELGAEVFTAHWIFPNAPGTEAFTASSPLLNVNSCTTCHPGGRSGIGPVGDGAAPEAMEIQLEAPASTDGAAPPGDPIYGHVFNTTAVNGVVPEGAVLVHYHEIIGYYYPDGGRWHLRRPYYELTQLSHGPLAATTVIKPRLAPQLFGTGLLELVDRAPKSGRLGWQATSRDICEQTAKAFSREMGVSSNEIPVDDCTAAEADCWRQHNTTTPGVSRERFEGVVAFVRALPPPAPVAQADDSPLGALLFTNAGCPHCHQPTLSIEMMTEDGRAVTTSISPYTDMQLHDLGMEMADQDASGRRIVSRWRTAPLWGLSYRAGPEARTTLLHDGRARSTEEAILWHGGEADFARANFAHLGPRSRRALLQWIGAL
jgi:CxxC motif-containing protein (DUF1111 family)